MKNVIKDSKPLYQQVEAGIKNDILTKKYAAGEQLPSESELAKQYGVSLITIRRAMDILVEQHLVKRIQGKGTFVIPQKEKAKLGVHGGFDSLFTEKGYNTDHKILSTKMLLADENISKKLGVKIDSEVSVIERLILEDDLPVAIDKVYVSESKIPDILFNLSETKSLYQTLKDKYEIDAKSADLYLNGTVASTELAEILECSIGDPLFLLEKTAYNENREEIIHYSISYIRCDRITYELSVN